VLVTFEGLCALEAARTALIDQRTAECGGDVDAALADVRAAAAATVASATTPPQPPNASLNAHHVNLDVPVACAPESLVVGTPAFMAPELYRRDGGGVAAYDARAVDVWAMGVALFVL
jgi:hypothetical protein